MSWPRPRFRVRGAMLGVLAIAVGLGVTLPAIEVARAPSFHVHTWINPKGVENLPPGRPIRLDQRPVTLSQVEMRSAPFWPRYWRCLLGRPWRGQSFCPLDPDHWNQACEYAYPGMVKWRADRSFDIDWAVQDRAGMRSIVPSVTLPNSSPPKGP